MKKLIILVMMLVFLMTNCVFSYANIDCGEGKLIFNDDGYTMETPNGYVFKLVDIQRLPVNGSAYKGSFSYNEMTNQLFVFRDVPKYYNTMLNMELDRELTPGVVFEVELLKGEI